MWMTLHGGLIRPKSIAVIHVYGFKAPFVPSIFSNFPSHSPSVVCVHMTLLMELRKKACRGKTPFLSATFWRHTLHSISYLIFRYLNSVCTHRSTIAPMDGIKINQWRITTLNAQTHSDVVSGGSGSIDKMNPCSMFTRLRFQCILIPVFQIMYWAENWLSQLR